MFRQYRVWLGSSGDGNVVLSELFYVITIIPLFARIAKKGNDEWLPVRKKCSVFMGWKVLVCRVVRWSPGISILF